MEKDDMEFNVRLQKGANIFGMFLLCCSVCSILVAMAIFSGFVSLQNSRTLLVKHLLVAHLFDAILSLTLQVLVLFARSHNLPDMRCLFKTTSFCEALIALSKYTNMVSIIWICLLVFYQRRNINDTSLGNRILVYSFVGWLLPVVPVSMWIIIMAIFHKEKCWEGHHFFPSIWILETTKLVLVFIFILIAISAFCNLRWKRRKIINFQQLARKRGQLIQCVVAALWIFIGYFLFLVGAHAPVVLDKTNMAALSYSLTMFLSSRGFVLSLIFCFIDPEVRETFRLDGSEIH